MLTSASRRRTPSAFAISNRAFRRRPAIESLVVSRFRCTARPNRFTQHLIASAVPSVPRGARTVLTAGAIVCCGTGEECARGRAEGRDSCRDQKLCCSEPAIRRGPLSATTNRHVLYASARAHRRPAQLPQTRQMLQRSATARQPFVPL